VRAQAKTQKAEESKRQAMLLMEEMKIFVMEQGSFALKSESGKKTRVLKKHLEAVFEAFQAEKPGAEDAWIPEVKRLLEWDEEAHEFKDPPKVVLCLRHVMSHLLSVFTYLHACLCVHA
jgi:hypothetical protein